MMCSGSVFYLSEKLKILTASISSGFSASSLQYVVFAYYFASKIASPLLLSEPGFFLLRISRISKNTEFTYCFVTIHGRGGTVSIVVKMVHISWWRVIVGFCHMGVKIVVIPSHLYNQTILK